MTYLQLEVTRTDLNGNTQDILVDVERITIRKGLDQKANTVTIDLKNAYGTSILGDANSHKWVGSDGELIWEEDDAITIKAKLNDDGTALDDNDLLTIADALEFNAKLESGRTTLTVKAVDKTFNLLNRSWVSAFTVDSGLTVPEIIKNVIDNVAESGEGDGVQLITTNLQTEPTYAQQKASATPGIQTRRIDDSLFPVTAIAKVWKPVYEWIDDLSTIQFTSPEDLENPVQRRKMKYYVDADNNFRWFYPDDDVDYTITIGSVSSNEDDVKSYNLTKSTFDVVNFVIYNGGLDFYGVGTLNYYFDESTKSKKLLTKYKAYTEVSKEIIQQEINAGNLVENASGTFTYQEVRYNRNGTVTPEWDSTASYTTDDQYNDGLRARIDEVCKARARAFTANRGNPRWKGSITIKGRNFVAGELCEVTSVVHGLNKELLRIQDLTHNITKDSWQTVINVEEDDPEIGEQGA